MNRLWSTKQEEGASILLPVTEPRCVAPSNPLRRAAHSVPGQTSLRASFLGSRRVSPRTPPRRAIESAPTRHAPRPPAKRVCGPRFLDRAASPSEPRRVPPPNPPRRAARPVPRTNEFAGLVSWIAPCLPPHPAAPRRRTRPPCRTASGGLRRMAGLCYDNPHETELESFCAWSASPRPLGMGAGWAGWDVNVRPNPFCPRG